jgi:hypothetical protein
MMKLPTTAIRLVTLLLSGALPVTACSAKKEDQPAGAAASAAAASPQLPPAHPPLPPSGQAPVAPPQPGMPAGHPPMPAQQGMPSFSHPQSGAQSTVNLAPEVKARWKSVRLAVAPKGGTEKTDTVTVGGKLAVGGTRLTLVVLAYVPAFTSNAGVVTTSSNEPNNPAVLVQLLDGGNKVAEGWVFQNLAEFNTFRPDSVQVRLVGGVSG